MKNLKRPLIWLILILILAAFLRLYRISSVPPSLDWDEAALGYNAYSILHTGKDEYGKTLPLTLKSFGDYKPALYSYLDVPFVAVFGLNEFSTRIVSALFGVGFVLLIYFFSLELFGEGKLALFCSLAAAISPISLQFSRGAWEANVAVTLNLLAVFFFIKFGGRRTIYLIFAGLMFIASLLTYQSSRLLVPLLVLSLFIIYFKKIQFNGKNIAVGLVFGLICALIYGSVFLGGQSNRLAVASVFSYSRPYSDVAQISNEDGLSINSLPFQVLHGEWFSDLRGVIERYGMYFSPKTLFISGDQSPRQNVPDFGVTFYSSIILIPLGLIYLWKRKKGRAIIFIWLVLSPIPAALSRDLIDMVRAENLVLPIVLMEGAGFLALLEYASRFKRLGFVCLVGFLAFFAFSFLIYVDKYYVHFPVETSEGWVYGYKEAFGKYNNFSNYNHVYITDFYGQPYIYYLYYSKYPPERIQSQIVLDQPSVDVGTVRRIDNLEFHSVSPGLLENPNSLIMATDSEISEKDIAEKGARVLDQINFLDGTIALRVIQTK